MISLISSDFTDFKLDFKNQSDYYEYLACKKANKLEFKIQKVAK